MASSALLRSTRPFDIAEQFTEEVWDNRYFFWRGSLWVWSDGMWARRTKGALRGEVAKWMAGKRKGVPDEDGGVREVPFNFSGRMRDDVCSFVLTHEIVDDVVRPPFDVRTGERSPDLDRLIMFRDKVVDVATMEVRDREWWQFHVVVSPFDWDEGAECPTWERCLGDWFGGDESAAELLERRIGYLRMGFRGFDALFLDSGLARAGKGCVDRIEEALLGPGNRLAVSLADMNDTFVTQGLETAQELVLHEFDEGDGKSRESKRLRQLLKQIVGRDSVRVRAMYQGPETLSVSAVPKLVGNAVPEIPDKAGGLWSKVKVLWYGNSHLGREDPGLEERLHRELQGIAVRTTRAAHRLWTAEPGERWPVQEGARHALEEAIRLSNPVEHWLRKRCRAREGSFVAKDLLYRDYVEFCRESEVGPLPRKRWSVAVRESSMGLQEGVRRVETEEGSRTMRVFYGLELRD